MIVYSACTVILPYGKTTTDTCDIENISYIVCGIKR